MEMAIDIHDVKKNPTPQKASGEDRILLNITLSSPHSSHNRSKIPKNPPKRLKEKLKETPRHHSLEKKPHQIK